MWWVSMSNTNIWVEKTNRFVSDATLWTPTIRETGKMAPAQSVLFHSQKLLLFCNSSYRSYIYLPVEPLCHSYIHANLRLASFYSASTFKTESSIRVISAGMKPVKATHLCFSSHWIFIYSSLQHMIWWRWWKINCDDLTTILSSL